MSKLDQSTLDAQEAQIPQLMRQAVKKAYENALRSGCDVVESKDGYLVRTSPDGTSIQIEALPPRHKVEVGRIVKLR